MDIKMQIKTANLLAKLINGDSTKLNSIQFTPQKELLPEQKRDENSLIREVPEKVGISSSYLMNFFQEISESKEIDAHSIMILRQGKVIAHAGFSPYRKDDWHISHSLCKSITSLAVGLLIDQGLADLDDKIVDICKKKAGLFLSSRMKHITIRHLLTMSSGVSFNEVGAIIENDWMKSYFESTVLFEPGSQFAYNSLNSYMLSAIVMEKTGKSLLDYLSEFILEPMGINDLFWEKCPKGIEKGGWGLSLTVEAMAKLGQLYLQEGNYNGVQLLSKQWIQEAVKKQINTDEDMNDFGYGFHVWMCKYPGSYQFNGMLGQNVVILPDKNMVVATCAGSSNLFPKSHMMDLIMKYFGNDDFCPKEVLKDNQKAFSSLTFMLERLEFHKSYYENKPFPSSRIHGGWHRPAKKYNYDGGGLPDFIYLLHDKEYRMEDSSASLLPLFIQCIHNNYSGGITKINFQVINDNLIMECTQTEAHNFIRIGFGTPKYDEVTFHGETYMVGTTGEITYNEDGVRVLKIQMCYIETSNTRYIKFIFEEDGLKMCLDELPGLTHVMDGAAALIGPAQKETGMNYLNTIADMEYTQYKLNKLISPVIKEKIEEEKPM